MATYVIESKKWPSLHFSGRGSSNCESSACNTADRVAKTEKSVVRVKERSSKQIVYVTQG